MPVSEKVRALRASVQTSASSGSPLQRRLDVLSSLESDPFLTRKCEEAEGCCDDVVNTGAVVNGRVRRSAAAPPRERKPEPSYKPENFLFKEARGFQIFVDESNRVDCIKVPSKQEAIDMVKSDPVRFLGCQWPRKGYAGESEVYPRSCRFGEPPFGLSSRPEVVSAMLAIYHPLPITPREFFVDTYTDSLLTTFKGETYTPRSPGRGQGIADVPGIKLVDEVNPSDIMQGLVGDCWLLCAISALAEFDGAIYRLFRKTPSLKNLPSSDSNRYIITLYDLASWTPVDIVIDERLLFCKQRHRTLGCNPSQSDELWAAYLEKAVAAHCGGWDHLDGGYSTHAFSMLTGCKHVYTIKKKPAGFRCYGTYNPNEERWEQLANSPHECFRNLWPSDWPELGGGGSWKEELSEAAMFAKLCVWDANNYIICAATDRGDQKEWVGQREGLEDGHAFTVISAVPRAGGTTFDMVQLRNPWGFGEFDCGGWGDNGKNWKRYPEVHQACGKPVARDDGVFWMQKEDFFRHFVVIYLCAQDMSEFINSGRRRAERRPQRDARAARKGG